MYNPRDNSKSVWNGSKLRYNKVHCIRASRVYVNGITWGGGVRGGHWGDMIWSLYEHIQWICIGIQREPCHHHTTLSLMIVGGHIPYRQRGPEMGYITIEGFSERRTPTPPFHSNINTCIPQIHLLLLPYTQCPLSMKRTYVSFMCMKQPPGIHAHLFILHMLPPVGITPPPPCCKQTMYTVRVLWGIRGV